MSSFERASDPMLGKNYTGPFIVYLGQEPIPGSDQAFQALLRRVASPDLSYIGVNGKAERKRLIEKLRSIEVETKALATSEKPAKAVAQVAGIAVQRICAELTLSRCLLEEGDSKGATEAFCLASEWTDKAMLFGGGVGTVISLHVLKERCLGVADALTAHPHLRPGDAIKIVEALKTQSNMRKVIASGVAYGYRASVLIPLYTVYSSRAEQRVVANIMRPKEDNDTALKFVAEVAAGHENFSDHLGTARLISEAYLTSFQAASKGWVPFRTSLDGLQEVAEDTWGTNPLKLSTVQMQDAKFVIALQQRLSKAQNPGGKVQATVFMLDLGTPFAAAFAFDGLDAAKLNILLSRVEQKSGKKLARVLDPLSNKPFAVTAGGLRSTYVPSKTDPEEIKRFAGQTLKF